MPTMPQVANGIAFPVCGFADDDGIAVAARIVRRTPCKTLVADADVRRLLDSPSGGGLAPYERLLASVLQPNERECPRCGERQLGATSTPSMVCACCGCSFCFFHSVAHDIHTPCNVFEASRTLEWAANVELISSTCKQCPGCRAPIEKIAGCNSMRCRCGMTFCYLCGCVLLDGGCDHFAFYNLSGCPLKAYADGSVPGGLFSRDSVLLNAVYGLAIILLSPLGLVLGVTALLRYALFPEASQDSWMRASLGILAASPAEDRALNSHCCRRSRRRFVCTSLCDTQRSSDGTSQQLEPQQQQIAPSSRPPAVPTRGPNKAHAAKSKSDVSLFRTGIRFVRSALVRRALQHKGRYRKWRPTDDSTRGAGAAAVLWQPGNLRSIMGATATISRFVTSSEQDLYHKRTINKAQSSVNARADLAVDCSHSLREDCDECRDDDEHGGASASVETAATSTWAPRAPAPLAAPWAQLASLTPTAIRGSARRVGSLLRDRTVARVVSARATAGRRFARYREMFRLGASGVVASLRNARLRMQRRALAIVRNVDAVAAATLRSVHDELSSISSLHDRDVRSGSEAARSPDREHTSHSYAADAETVASSRVQRGVVQTMISSSTVRGRRSYPKRARGEAKYRRMVNPQHTAVHSAHGNDAAAALAHAQQHDTRDPSFCNAGPAAEAPSAVTTAASCAPHASMFVLCLLGLPLLLLLFPVYMVLKWASTPALLTAMPERDLHRPKPNAK